MIDRAHVLVSGEVGQRVQVLGVHLIDGILEASVPVSGLDVDEHCAITAQHPLVKR